MNDGPGRTVKYEPLLGNAPNTQVANALRKLANRASPNSARALEQRMSRWPVGKSHGTISAVLSGEGAAKKLENVTFVARAVAQNIPGLDQSQQDAEVRRITQLFESAFAAPRTWSRDITRHCSNVAFDWASALPYEPRFAHELIATIAIREGVPTLLRTEVLGPELATAIVNEVMQGAPARKVGNDHLPNEGWTDNGDDGPTWHGMWGPIGDGSRRFLAVHLDALGAVSVYLRAATSTGIGVEELAMAALETAYQVLYKIGWIGAFGVLVRSVSPARGPQKNSEFGGYVPSRDRRGIVNGPAKWTTHARSVEQIPLTQPDDFYGHIVVSAQRASESLGMPIEIEPED
jgi:hypothetical protein